MRDGEEVPSWRPGEGKSVKYPFMVSSSNGGESGVGCRDRFLRTIKSSLTKIDKMTSQP